MAVTYEWDIETIDPKTEDILDHDFSDDLKSLLPRFVTQDPTMRLVLVRNVGNNLEGLTDRLWAYMDNNWNLPKYFTDTLYESTEILVPTRFHRIIARAAK